MNTLTEIIDPKELECPKGDRLIYDWVSFSTRIHNPVEIMALIGMSNCPWEILTSGNGYTHRHYFGGVSISFCESDMSHVAGFYLLEMSGQGCRTFETYGNGNYESLFKLVRAEVGKPKPMQDVRLTRLDVAFDDMSGLLDIDTICDKTRLEEFVSRIQRYEAIYGSKGNSVNFGAKGSNVFIRIYDKARERGYTDGRHWIRCELQLRKENACGFVNKIPEHGLSELYCGVLKNYLSFREVDEDDSNKRRWSESPWWTSFINSTRAISILEKPGVIYNLSACEKYVLTQPVGSIKTLIHIYGTDAFIEMIRKAPSPKNPKYKRLIDAAEQDRLNRESLSCDKFQDLHSDEELEELFEFTDELRAEYDSILLDAKSKDRNLKRKEAEEYLRNHGLDTRKVPKLHFSEEWLRSHGINLK